MVGSTLGGGLAALKLEIRAVGRIKAGPERALLDDYLARARAVGRGLGIAEVGEYEIDARKLSSRAAQTDALLADPPAGARMIVLDERGESLSSRAIAGRLTGWRDQGAPAAVFLIGGADGFDPNAPPAAAERWAFGPATWPHKLVRLMLAEQLYRALSLMAGAPYHRD